MQIPVTIFDVMGAAAYRNRNQLDIFLEYYRLGLLPVEGQERIVRATLKIRKPCRYLEAEKCTVYPVRPLACALFPEHLAVSGSLPEKLSQPHFRDYLCLHQGIEISEQRSQVAKRLNGKLQRELLVSDWYLFGCSPFFIDLKNLEVNASDEVPCGERDFEEKVENSERCAVSMFDDLFQKTFSGFRPFDQVEGNMARLARVELQEKLLASLENDKLLKKLARKCHDMERVFRIKDGQLKERKIGLSYSSAACLF